MRVKNVDEIDYSKEWEREERDERKRREREEIGEREYWVVMECIKYRLVFDWQFEKTDSPSNYSIVFNLNVREAMRQTIIDYLLGEFYYVLKLWFILLI